MSYATHETSIFNAAPVELYQFAQGLQTFEFTSGDKPQVHEGKAYLPEAISRTAIDQSQEDQAGSITISLPRDTAVAKLFIAYLPVVPVAVSVYRFHRGDGEYVKVFTGTVTSARFEGAEAKLIAMPSSQALRRVIPIVLYQPQCNHALFSKTVMYGLEGSMTQAEIAGCGLIKEQFRTQASVESVGAVSVVAPEFATKPDGYFTFGFLEAANGEVRYITRHVGNSVTLTSPLGLKPGDSVGAFPGCDGLETTCVSKFANVENFNGFSRVPTKNPFNGSLV